ncbi:hypothetical protein Ahy_A01g001977 [Arachis hypogaea]|uniref:SWIM-type domain-containing protein n=1 Tax=Arachis hypogaea TaxID=3818 RepID=A0A445EPS9_ARAHY|nr:hypothetical protein Ahy_A01g001977 [Arachis hypogaea]
MGTKKSAKAKYNRPIGGRGPKSPGPISAGGPKFSRPVGAKANFKIQKNTAQKGATSTSFGTNFGGRGATIPRSEESNSGEDDEKSAENVDEEDPIFEQKKNGHSLPCVHALAAIARRGDRPETYVHPLLKIGAALATYQHCIQPVNSKEYWEKTNYLNSIPPKLKRPVGRPVKRRRKDKSEKEVSRTDNNKSTVSNTLCQVVGNYGTSNLPSTRAKQPIIRPHHPTTIHSSTPPPIPPPGTTRGVSAETVAAASEGTASRMFQFIPNPGFKHPRKK